MITLSDLRGWWDSSFPQATQLVNDRAGLSWQAGPEPLQYGPGENPLTLEASPFHHMPNMHGSAKSLLFMLKQGLKLPFTVIPLISTEQDAIGTQSQNEATLEVGMTQAPISLVDCLEEDVSSPPSADCYAQHLHG